MVGVGFTPHRLKTGRCDLSHRLIVAQWRPLGRFCALVPSVRELRMKNCVIDCWNLFYLTVATSSSPVLLCCADLLLFYILISVKFITMHFVFTKSKVILLSQNISCCFVLMKSDFAAKWQSFLLSISGKPSICHFDIHMTKNLIESTWLTKSEKLNRFLTIISKVMADDKLIQVILQAKTHPLPKASPYVLQQALKFINANVPTLAASTILKVNCDIEDAGIIKWFTNNNATVSYLKKQIDSFNIKLDVGDHLKIVVADSDAKRVKISIRMPNLGEIEEIEYKAMWAKHNTGLDTSQWSFLENASRCLKGGYMLIYLMVNETSLSTLKKPDDKYYLNCGVGGLVEVKVFNNRQQEESGKRKIGQNYNPKTPETPKNKARNANKNMDVN